MARRIVALAYPGEHISSFALCPLTYTKVVVQRSHFGPHSFGPVVRGPFQSFFVVFGLTGGGPFLALGLVFDC